MKTNFIFAVMAFSLISIATLNVLLNQQEKVSLSTVAMANLNALADTENGENPDGGENPGGGDFKYKIEKERCYMRVESETQASNIFKIFGIKVKVGVTIDLTDATALYRIGGNYRFEPDRTCAIVCSTIN